MTLPPKKPQKLPPAFGFVYNAERLNSRAAMVGGSGMPVGVAAGIVAAWQSPAAVAWLPLVPGAAARRPRPPHDPSPPAASLPFASQIGFCALLAVELVAGQGLLDMLGFTTGKGLGFEF